MVHENTVRQPEDAEQTAEAIRDRDGRTKQERDQREQDVKEQEVRRIETDVLAVLHGASEASVKLSALVSALAKVIVDYAHEEGRLVLEQVAELRDSVHERINPSLAQAVIERIARDPTTVASVKGGDPLGTLIDIVSVGHNRRGSPFDALAAALLGSRGKK